MNHELNKKASLLMSLTLLMAQPMTVVASEAYMDKPEYIEHAQYLSDSNEMISTTTQGSLSHPLFPEENEPLEIADHAKTADVVYTQAFGPNDAKLGDGSASNPYNRFEDAVANVPDGGTIIIKSGKSAFLNTQDEYGEIPFIINKNVTITAEEGSVGTLVVRAGGIILQGDVTFKNVNFSFANKLHDSIFANGYNLELIDCTRERNTRQIDLFTGSLYSADNASALIKGHIYHENGTRELITPKVGTNGNITIQTSRGVHSEFGKVFAGSMNGSFDGDSNITINKNGSLSLVSIHSSGAKEAPVGNMFDFTEPAPPAEDPVLYPTIGTVNVNLTNFKTNVYGADSATTNVTFSTQYPIEYVELRHIDQLTISNGKITPDHISWNKGFGNLKLASNGELDLSRINPNTHEFEINDLIGGGTLTLHTEGLLTVHGKITNTTKLQTIGGSLDGSYSGITIGDHVYVKSTSGSGDNASFDFTPYQLQTGYELQKIDSKWKVIVTQAALNIPTSLSHFSFASDTLVWDISKFKQLSNGQLSAICPSISLNFGPELVDPDAVYHLVYNISVNGIPFTQFIDDDGYLSWKNDELKMELELGVGDYADGRYFLTFVPPFGTFPELGTYEVEVELPFYNLKSNMTLNVIDTKNATIPQQTQSTTQMTILSNGSLVDENHPAVFNETLSISALIDTKQNSHISTTALIDEVELVVNGKIVASSSLGGNLSQFELAITPENGFIAGSNEIKVLYGGTTDVFGSMAKQTIIIEKMEPIISLDSVTTPYDGEVHPLRISVDSLTQVEPIISYYPDNSYTEGTAITAPQNVGTYYAEIYIPETTTSKAKTLKEGLLTIEKITPELYTIGSFVYDAQNSTAALSVQTDVLPPRGCSIPIGMIEFICTNATGTISNKVTVPLNYGTATYTFDALPYDTYTVTAKYLPEIQNIQDINYNESATHSKSFVISDKTVSATEIKLNADHITLDLNGTYTEKLIATIAPSNASNQKVKWSSSHPNIVEVDEYGNLTAKSTGTAQIIAMTLDGSNLQATCSVKVIASQLPVKVDQIIISSPSLTLTQGASHQLSANVEPSNADDQRLIWSSSDDTIISIDQTGKVTALKKGEARITVATLDGSISSTCIITVTEPTSGDTNTGGSTGGGSSSGSSSSGSSKPTSSEPTKPTSTPEEKDSAPAANDTTSTAPSINVATQFKDTSKHWAKESIQFVVDKNLFNGVSEKSFGADESMTRGMVATVLHRMAGTPTLADTKAPFFDLKSGAYYEDGMLWTNAMGIITGVNSNKMAPNDHVTREQLAVMFYRYADAMGYLKETPSTSPISFKDSSNVSDWAVTAIDWAVSNGILSGRSNGTIDPSGVATRAEVAAIIHRFYGVIEE